MVKYLNNIYNKIVDSFELVYTKYRETKLGQFNKRFFEKGNRRFVLCLYLIALIVFGATLLSNQLIIAMTGDFKLQEIPFYFNGYDDWWESLLSGEFKLWDDSGFLGQNNIGTNTFYYLWNIFFLPTLLVPRVLVPQALAFLIITKFVLAGYVMKILLDYFNVSDRTSKIMATAYAFSGWAFYYLWFNHFLEIAVLFPWVLYGIEKVLKEKKVGPLILSLFVSAMTNYFFFIMFCFCGVIYALFRFFQLFKTYTTKDRFLVMGLGILSFAIAITMALIILVPAFSVAMNSSRADTSSGYVHDLKEALKALQASLKHEEDAKSFSDAFKELWDLCFKFQGTNQKKNVMYPLVSYFFAPYSCYDSPLFSNNGYDNTNCSLFMYTPFTLLLIPSLIQSFREKKVSHFVGFIGMVIMIFSPFFYYCFTGFTSVCYGRWQLFVVAAMVIYCAINLDKIKQMKGWYFDLSFFICLVFEIVLIILAIKYQGTMGTKNLISNTKVEDKLICAIIQPMILTVMYFILRHNFKKDNFGKKLNWAVIAEIAFVGNMVVLGQGTCDYSTLYGGQNDVKSATKLIADINKNDKTYYRMFNTSADRDANNLGMVEGYRGVSTFHSMYNYSLNELGEWSRLTYTTSSKSWRPWSMGYHEKRWNLDTILGIKYYIVNNNDSRINKNDSIVKIVDNKWTFNGANSSIKAFSPYDIENDTDYIISSISLKQHKGDHDIYTVEFSNDNASQDVKTYNVTIENDRLINVQVGSNGNWFFNELDIGVKAYKECLNSTTSSVITSFQKLDGSDVYHINFTNGNSCNSILNLGEDKNVPCGYKEIARDNYNVVYENENFINLGLSFDNLTSSEYVSSSDSYLGGNYAAKVVKNEMAYVRTAILDRKDIDEINSLYEGVFTSHTQSNDTIYTNSDINNELHVFNINNNNINVYLQNWNHSTGVALNYASPVKYPADGISQIYWNSYMDVDLSSLQVASEAKERGGAFVTVNGRMGENLMITLYGQDDNGNEIELNRDIHMKHNYDKSGDWKYERGFYVNQRVTRVVVRAYDTFKKDVKFAKPNITVQYYDSYVNNINKLKQYELKDVVCKTNELDFKTDYDNTRLQVLTIPYDSGWKLTRIDENGNRENVKLYMAQGGFNSFVAESGNYSYELTYSTPGLSTGILGFGIGLSLFSALYIAFDLDFLQKKQIKKLLAID